jgi:hypothetical protein
MAAEAITIAPQIIPLLRGKVRISLMKAEAPAFILELPAESPGKEKSIPFPSAIIQEKLPPLLKLLESEAPRLTVEIEKGRLDLLVGKQPVFWFEKIQGRINLPPDQLRIDVTCKSNVGEKVLIAAALSSKDLNGNASIHVTDLNLRPLPIYFAPANAPHLESSRGNLKMDLEIDQGQTLRGKIQASFSSLTFQDGGKKTPLKGITMRAVFQTTGDKATISLAELSLQNPRLRFGGGFSVDLSAPLFRLELSAQEIDVFLLREIMLGWVGKIEPIQTILGIVRDGRVSSVSFKTHGRSPADLGELKNISVQGRLVGGRIFLSKSLTRLKDIDFDLRQVSGELLIHQGILEGRNLAAQWEKTGITRGLLKLGLGGDKTPFHLETLADADLAQFPPFLEKIIGNQSFSEEIG